MSEKIKALVNSIFVHLNRYDKQQPDFSPDNFLRDLELFFSELDRLDLSGESATAVDEALKLRVNTVARNAQPVTMSISNLLPLYFWYVRRPPQQCQNAFLAAKKLRGYADDSQFVEQAISPLIFGDKIRGLGNREQDFRVVLLHRTAQVTANFKATDQVNISATRIVRTDSWQKKMIHIAALNQQGRKGEIRSFAPEDELKLISSHNDFSRWYLRKYEIYKGKNPIIVFLNKFFDSIASAILSVFNYRFVIHVFRDRRPVYLVYLIFTLLCLYFAMNMKHYWEGFHRKNLRQFVQTTNPIGRPQ